MQYNGLVIAAVVVAVLLLGVVAHLLLRRGWFLGWLRGTAGFLGLVAAVYSALLAWDLSTYYPLPQSGETLLTISFDEVAPQSFDVSIDEEGRHRVVPLSGDLWQLDVRVMRWRGLADLIGLQPGYRLDRLSGRYLSAEQEAVSSTANLALLSDNKAGIDLWRWLRDNRHDFGLFEPWGGRVNFQPMADRAVYKVSLGTAGLMVEPSNVAAREAAAKW